MNTLAPADKFRRYRAAQRSRGLRLARLWVVDASAPGFQERLDRALLRGNAAPEEADAADFIAAALEDHGANGADRAE